MAVLLRGLAHLANSLHCVHSHCEGRVLESLDESGQGLGVPDLPQREAGHRAHREGVVLQATHESTHLTLRLRFERGQRLSSAEPDLPARVVQGLRDLRQVGLVAHAPKRRHRGGLRPSHLRGRAPATAAHDQRQARGVLAGVSKELRDGRRVAGGLLAHGGQRIRSRCLDAHVLAFQQILDLGGGILGSCNHLGHAADGCHRRHPNRAVLV
mmetsp:Transcript_32450/g.89496  ORF Transcript_32450/g.89496 Transcript_32450/m.89496 type:complete len:212 (+) Transcript_32450:615-1250(+)